MLSVETDHHTAQYLQQQNHHHHHNPHHLHHHQQDHQSIASGSHDGSIGSKSDNRQQQQDSQWTPQQQRVALRAAHKAKQVARDMDQHSSVVSLQKEQALPRLQSNEIVVGQLLGEGAFNMVYSVQEILLLQYNPDSAPGTNAKRAQMASQPSKYALKCLNPNLLMNVSNGAKQAKADGSAAMKDDPDAPSQDEKKKVCTSYVTGCADLVVEAKLLASLPGHAHLISLHAIVHFSHLGHQFGLLLDALQGGTLQDKMEKWASERAIHTSLRLRIASQIASALVHLHQHGIVYRDVKPTNVGFDTNGCVRVFDLGLAKELTENLKTSATPQSGTTPPPTTTEQSPQATADSDDKYATLYNLTAMTGSKRYMAPEVALGQPYNLTADVYSFSILLWEMLALRRVFFGMGPQEHFAQVVKAHYRPPLQGFPMNVCQLLEIGWAPALQKRPSMQQVQRMLKGRAA